MAPFSADTRGPVPAGSLTQRWLEIDTFIMDMDGVLTNSYVLCYESGEVVRGLHSKDGFALQLAARLGYRLCVLSGGHAPAMETRFSRLGVGEVLMNVPYKLDAYTAYRERHGLQNAQILYIGDDVPDYEVMQKAGLAVAPADAAPDILHLADFITQREGGRGCVREVIERTLKLQNRWYSPEALTW